MEFDYLKFWGKYKDIQEELHAFRKELNMKGVYPSEEEMVDTVLSLNRHALAVLRSLKVVFEDGEVEHYNPISRKMRLYRKNSVPCDS